MVLVYTLHLRVTSYPDKIFYSQCILSVIHGFSRIGTILLQEGEWPLCKMQHPCTYMSIQFHLAPCRILMSWSTFHFLRVCQSDDQGLPDQLSFPYSHWNDSRSFSAPTCPMVEIESVCQVEEAAKEQFGIFTMWHLGLVWVVVIGGALRGSVYWCAEVVVYPRVWSPPTSPGLGGPFGHGSCFTCLFIWLTLFRLGTSEVEEGTPVRGTILYGHFGILIFIACTDYYCYSLIDLLLLQVLADEWHPVLM